MGPRVKHRSSIRAACALFVALAGVPAWAAEMQVGDASLVAPTRSDEPLSTLSVSNMSALTIGMTPITGTRGVRAMSGGLGLSDMIDVNSEYSTQFYGSDVGLFGGRTERPSIFAPTTATAWNLGGSVGYRGFYFRAGVSGTPALGPFESEQAWQAGFGFATGALDLRLTYLTSQTANFGMADRDLDRQQWTIGGIYRLSPTVRLNADAFYGLRDSHTGSFFTPQPGTNLHAPQGTGARVGIQLRF